ncbi:putative knottin, scorpion toxin [Lupinus albus]|uniref:Putative knottin, scorpion toxin n=1 Tax=Lupinus albus TaxID=3870 RepID=A0A6A4QRU2_LUPAL|nr:putative knottin, scorpion toxin [Lupinus albus]
MGPTMVAEARTCLSNCAAVCNSEKFLEGHCDGFPRRCFCSINCPLDAINYGSESTTS